MLYVGRLQTAHGTRVRHRRDARIEAGRVQCMRRATQVSELGGVNFRPAPSRSGFIAKEEEEEEERKKKHCVAYEVV
jgi:hypothetical protein